MMIIRCFCQVDSFVDECGQFASYRYGGRFASNHVEESSLKWDSVDVSRLYKDMCVFAAMQVDQMMLIILT